MSMNGTQMPEMADFSVGKWSDFWSENDLASARSALDAARSGKVGRFDASVATGATTVSWWDVVITPILDANGEPEISRDISHTKQLEAQLRYLAESGEVLGSSLRIDETLVGIARLAGVADWTNTLIHVAFDGTISWISAGAPRHCSAACPTN
jgi:hypothetical protein